MASKKSKDKAFKDRCIANARDDNWHLFKATRNEPLRVTVHHATDIINLEHSFFGRYAYAPEGIAQELWSKTTWSDCGPRVQMRIEPEALHFRTVNGEHRWLYRADIHQWLKATGTDDDAFPSLRESPPYDRATANVTNVWLRVEDARILFGTDERPAAEAFD